jgi:hypothetical protein
VNPEKLDEWRDPPEPEPAPRPEPPPVPESTRSERWAEWTSWVAPMDEWSFLSLRTIFLSYAVGAIIGYVLAGTGTVATVICIVVGTPIYVVAALYPLNITTCRYCGTEVHPRASVCRACGNDLIEPV